MVFLSPRPGTEEIGAFYDEGYYGKERRKFLGVIEKVIEFLTWWKWRKLPRLLQPEGRLLDVGCGRGTLVELARAAGYEAYGVERPFPGKTSAPYIFQKELAECQFPDRHFQMVVLWHVLEHLPDPRAALQEMNRVLQPGGWLSIAVPNFGSAQARASGKHWFHLDLPRHFWHFRQSALQALLERHGFRVARCSTFSLEYDWFGTLQSWMNRLIGDESRFFILLKGRQAKMTGKELARLLFALVLALPALGSALWDGARGQGGTLTILAQKTEG